MSFIGPLLIASDFAPIFSIVPAKLKALKITPMLPTMLVGCAMTVSAPQTHVISATCGHILK